LVPPAFWPARLIPSIWGKQPPKKKQKGCWGGGSANQGEGKMRYIHQEVFGPCPPNQLVISPHRTSHAQVQPYRASGSPHSFRAHWHLSFFSFLFFFLSAWRASFRRNIQSPRLEPLRGNVTEGQKSDTQTWRRLLRLRIGSRKDTIVCQSVQSIQSSTRPMHF
jgi:hypothetical protein